MASTYEMTSAQANAAHLERCRALQRRSQLGRFLSKLAYYNELPKGYKLKPNEEAELKIVKEQVKLITAELEKDLV